MPEAMDRRFGPRFPVHSPGKVNGLRAKALRAVLNRGGTDFSFLACLSSRLYSTSSLLLICIHFVAGRCLRPALNHHDRVVVWLAGSDIDLCLTQEAIAFRPMHL